MVKERTSGSRANEKAAGIPAEPATEYQDMVIHAHRASSRTIELTVEVSPAGSTSRPISVPFAGTKVSELRAAFQGKVEGSGSGRMQISQAEATVLGKQLAAVLFPGQIFRLLAESLARCVRRPGGGLRLRLAFDESLIDLPWEYVCRPDGVEQAGLSGFLLLDPRISMVRMSADQRLTLDPIVGRQRLAFVGTLWEKGRDGWGVRNEFDRLRAALQPVSTYITPRYTTAASAEAFDAHLGKTAAIFHYAGHCDFSADGRAFLVRELTPAATLAAIPKVYIDEIAKKLAGSPVRLCVMSACNSGFWRAVEPLLRAGIPAVIGINGLVASDSTVEFCAKLYESLAVGLSLDEAIGRARVQVMQWGRQHGLFDWGLYMTYMPSSKAVLFPRAGTAALARRQTDVRRDHRRSVEASLDAARSLDGINFGEIMSDLIKRRVLILGRFTDRRLKVLKAIQEQLAAHPNGYIPELFTFRRPEARDLVESIIAMAALSRFIIADLSEPRSVQSELEAIVPHFQSVPVVPLLNRSGREYATFASIRRRPNVVQPTVRYQSIDDLKVKVNRTVIPQAEERLEQVRPGD